MKNIKALNQYIEINWSKSDTQGSNVKYINNKKWCNYLLIYSNSLLCFILTSYNSNQIRLVKIFNTIDNRFIDYHIIKDLLSKHFLVYQIVFQFIKEFCHGGFQLENDEQCVKVLKKLYY